MSSLIEKVVRMITDRGYRSDILTFRGFYKWMPDEAYLKMRYKLKTGKELNLSNPQTFNEKIQWRKLYDRKPEYTTMVDKYEAKQYVAERIGSEHIVPTLGVWNHFDDIDFDALPDRFVLKCTHDSGGLVIVRNKKELNKEQARTQIEKSLKCDYYIQGREWPYKNVKRKVMAEQYLENENGEPLRDYKFYCFNGEPKFLYISQGLENHATAKISFVTCDWQFAPYERSDYRPFTKLPAKPKHFEEMMEYARKLSNGNDFLRVDLYEIDEKVYFSELTFSPCGGFMPFKNPEHDREIGEMMKLTK